MSSKSLFALFSLLLVSSMVFAGDNLFVRSKNRIPGEYLVLLNPAAPPNAEVAAMLKARFDVKVGQSYNLMRGFAIQASEAQAMALSRHPFIDQVEENFYVESAGSQATTAPDTIATEASTWHLDRLDQANGSTPKRDDTYSWCNAGYGARIYVFDTGIRPDHPEFAGRLDTVAGQEWISYAEAKGSLISQYVHQPGWLTANWSAAAGHGTAVASIAAGTTYGVAKGATLVDVRTSNAFDGNARADVVLTAIEWLHFRVLPDTCRHYDDPNLQDPAWDPDPEQEWYERPSPSCSYEPKERAVANFSMNLATTQIQPTGYYSILSAAVDRLSKVITVVTAAGNSNANIYWYWPSNSAYDITVAGLNKVIGSGADARWQHSNYGGVELYAPAQYVEAASHRVIGSSWVPRSQLSDCSSYPYDTCTSGTSFAAPQAAGAAARYLQSSASAKPSSVRSFLLGRPFATVPQPDGSTKPILSMSSSLCP